MADPTPNDNVSAESRRVFEQFVSRHGVDSNEAFDQLCSAFPGIAGDLRKLRDQTKQAQLSASQRPASVVETLRKRYGNTIDPNVSLDPRESQEAAPSQPARTSKPPSTLNDELIEKIAKHSSPNPRYTFKGEVARGGMGAILKVWDGDLRRNLAMKVILGGAQETQHEKEVPDPSRIARFLEEAQVTGQLDHPGIVPVHELGVGSDGRVYFTMRLVHGRDFQTILDLVKDGKEGWNQTRALGTILRVCEAMAFAHTKGVIHRDLKPANIMVGHFGETYVMDWGLAKVLGKTDAAPRPKVTDSMDESSVRTLRRDAVASESASALLTMDGEVLGTPCYMSPEQAQGRLTEMGPASDVYSIGAILYHLLAGQMPYVEPGTNVTAYMVLDRVKKGPPRKLQDINPKLHNEIVAICEKAMSRDATLRYPNMGAMADDLRNYLEGRVVKAYASGAFIEFKKWVLRNKATASALLLAILVAIGGSILVAMQEKQKQVELAKKNTEIQNEKKNVETANKQLTDANVQILAAKKEAENNAEDAKKAQHRAEESLAEYQRMADVKHLVDIQEKSEPLFISYPPPRAAMEQWLAEAKEFAKKEAGHRANYETILKSFEAEKDKLSLQEKTERRWKIQVLSELVKGLDDINRERGTAGRIRGYLNLWDATTGANSGWPEAIASISDTKDCPLYQGLRVQPQYGLRPIAKNPKSGLWEFVHLETGEAPEVDAAGNYKITSKTGIILVLVPGGKFDMGSVAPSRINPINSPNVDPFADSSVGPVHSVSLKPFFISKYEMSRPQWARLAGADPSRFYTNMPGPDDVPLPVDSVTWDMCMTELPKTGLTLPTESQWEFAARAGTTSVWWTGNVEKTTEGAANLMGNKDGFDMSAPIGSTRPNPFGLFDTIGNVSEWCRTKYHSYSAPNDRDDDPRPNQQIKKLCVRGGNFMESFDKARSASRDFEANPHRSHMLGLRPIREVIE